MKSATQTWPSRERLSIGKLKHGDLAQVGERLGAGTCGEENKKKERSGTFHAALLALFCAAIMPHATSRTNPNTAVTARLSIAPGAAFGNRRTWFNSAIE
jgi:hypothetical protein